MRRYQQRGIFFITFALWAVVLLGIAGVALDGGRLFVNRKEVQAFADAAALSAARKLDGKPAGIRAATEAARTDANTWDFGTRAVEQTDVEYSTAEEPDIWDANPGDPAGYTRVRVTAQINQRLFFAPLFVVRNQQLVRVRAVAEQARANQFKQGLWPFSVPAIKGRTGPHFGLEPGRLYTIRYASGGRCAADQNDPADPGDGLSRTWWGPNGEEVLRDRIVAGTHIAGEEAVIGRRLPELSVPLEGGAAFVEIRRSQDTDTEAANYEAYLSNGAGNGRRVVVMPILDAGGNLVKGFGMFFIPPAADGDGGATRSWCVEYAGKAFLPNSPTPGAGAPAAYSIQLVRE